MNASVNPIVPAPYDVVWTVSYVVGLALCVVALVSIARSAKYLRPPQALIWTLVAIVVPLVGPLAWLTIGRVSTSANSPATGKH